MEGREKKAPARASVRRGVMALLILITLAAYLPVLRADFINFDDPEYVVENSQVRHGLTSDSVAWAITAFHSANWHPVTWLSHMADVSLFGLNPAGHHGMNIALHGLCAVLLLRWLWAIGLSIWAGWWVAALFALHPSHVESVAWISERKDVLCALWGVAALWCYHHWAERQRMAYYVGVLICTALALLSKPMLVTLPFLFLLLDGLIYQRLRAARGIRRCLLEKMPLFAMVAGVIVLTIRAQGGDGAVMPLAYMAWPQRLVQALAAYGFYLWKFLLPVPLYVPYAAPSWERAILMAVGGSVAIGGMGYLTWRYRERAPLAALGLCWFLGLLVPVIGLVKAGEQYAADRYTYLPYVGLTLVATAVGQVVARRAAAWDRCVSFVALASLLLCAALTWHQAGYWESSERLFRHSLAHSPRNTTAHNNLGTALMARGVFPEALYHFQEAVAAAPGNLQAQNNLGVALLMLGKAAAAARQFEALLLHMPEDAEVWVNYGAAEFALGNLEEAQVAARRALEYQPGNGNALGLLDRVAAGNVR